MSRTRLVVFLVTLSILLPPRHLLAQTPFPGDWAVVDAQPVGTPLVAEIVGGQTLEGTFIGSRQADITLALPRGEHRAIPKSSVTEVRTRERVGDPLRGGMTRGGLLGAAAMAVMVAGLYWACELTCDAPSVPSVLFPALAIGAGAGIGVGAAVDAVIRRPLILYRSGK